MDEVGGQFSDGTEITNEGEAGEEGKGDPKEMFGGFDANFAQAGGRFVQFYAFRTVSFYPAFHPQEDVGPHGLGAGKAAPEAASEGGEEEEGDASDDEQEGKIDEVLRPEGEAKDVKFAGGQVEEDRLLAVP